MKNLNRPSLTQEETTQLEVPITLNELKNAIFIMKK